MARYFMSSIFDSTGKFQLNEDLNVEQNKDSRVDGENIIGSVQGVFFVPNGFSRNNRFYPCELWQKQLSDEDINRRLQNSIMFGCIGHSTGPVTEQDLSEGRVSHIMDKLWIDESTGMGMGKAYILNTPAGRNLRTYLKAGSNLKVSSRGEGSFAEGIEKDGHPVVEASSYNLITFDFVIEPGFTETNPQIMENYIEEVLVKEDKNGKEADMSMEKILEEYKSERNEARALLEKEKAEHSEKINELNEQLKDLQEKLSKTEKRTKLSLSVARTESKKLNAVLEDYKKIGSTQDLQKMMSISKAVIQELKEYKTLGSIKEIKEAMNQLVKVSSTLNEYKKLGSIKSIKELLAVSERFVTLQNRKKILDEAKSLSEDYHKPIEDIAKMINEQGLEQTKKSLEETKTKDKENTKFDVMLETKPTETKKTESVTLVESVFEDACARMFIHEEDDDMEDEKEVKVDDEEEDINDEDKEAEEDKEETDDESSDDDEEEETTEERVDNIEDKLDSVQAQVDALSASFDRLQGEESLEDEEDDFDFEIE